MRRSEPNWPLAAKLLTLGANRLVHKAAAALQEAPRRLIMRPRWGEFVHGWKPCTINSEGRQVR